MFSACNGPGKLPGTNCRMDGFNHEHRYGGPAIRSTSTCRTTRASRTWIWRTNGSLADRMFESQLDESFVGASIHHRGAGEVKRRPARLYWGCDGGRRSSTLTKQRIDGNAQRAVLRLQDAGRRARRRRNSPWRFYATRYGNDQRRTAGPGRLTRPSSTFSKGPIGNDVVSPNWSFITDVRAGKLASFTWITPTCDDSDHIACWGRVRPFVGRRARQHGRREKFWDSTAIFVNGTIGRPLRPRPTAALDYDGTRLRVPLLVISPYAKKNYVSHVQYETASVLRFAEDLYG